MEVIFIKDLRGQGKKGDIKDVKTGYAENYLIKNGYAVLKTKDSLRQLEKENKEKKARVLEEQEKAKELKKLIDKEVLEFQVKTGAGDNMPIRTLPNNLEAEESVLGACFLTKYAMQKAIESVSPEDFYDEKNQKIFKSIIELSDESTPLDLTTLTAKLQ